MTTRPSGDRPAKPDARERRPGELTAREFARWIWRQISSMRTALILLLVLALAAIPGSVIPQQGVDSLAVTRWKDQHPKLTPLYEHLDLFSVYSSPWFSAIYLLLTISLVGCIVPRLFVYLRALRAQPPAAPRHLTRLPVHASYRTDLSPDEVLDRARKVLGRRHRLRLATTGDDAVSAERGYLREAGNLVFHLSVLIVLAGFAVGGLWGYQGGVILVQGSTFSNNLTQYDDFKPGGLFTQQQMKDFRFSVDDFRVDWLKKGPRAGQARKFEADLSYKVGQSEAKDYTLKVNHPLNVDGTEVFLIGHGYAPVITVRDGKGDIVATGPTVFLPQDATFLSFGVVKAPAAKPGQIGLEGLFYPTFEMVDGDPVTVFGDDLFPTLSLLAYTGDLGLDDGRSQSVYVLDKSKATPVEGEDGKPFRLDLQVGDTVELPDGLGTVTFDRVDPWIRVQISQTPGKGVALVGVVLALIGLCMSLFLRPRRVWVRAVAVDAAGTGPDTDDADAGDTMDGTGGTRVEVAVLDRSGNGETDEILARLLAQLQEAPK
ncbi:MULTISPECIES: cytochrome c biogenesis protein ResB [unclassified Nocardioides]|uniref:cytochrome c biogenesis protein ResB n=1 Tax=unclassified Nocardioides TaxID=2615069 RepID=UPI0006F389C2|nr:MULTISPECIES: cytochrome c biogenesis protein ResB [unclassified Nocardioides]KRA30058.1 cytochrome C biogenesis protein [Nocardioides sp. Root614]KRA86978.1 cytochrome C biogenesis protein [Nocardioides sp. Root682]